MFAGRRVLAFALPALLAAAAAVARDLPNVDRASLAAVDPAAVAALERRLADPALARIGRAAHVDARFALPTFVWANPAAAPASGPGAAARRAAAGVAARPARAAEAAARDHLGRVAPLYGLARRDLEGLTLRHLHDTGRGGVVATFAQVLDGVEVFRDALRVLMDRDHRLIAVSGFVPGRARLPRGEAAAFRLTPAEAAARALEDASGVAHGPGLVRERGPAPGGYRAFDLAAGAGAVTLSQPLRVRPVWYHLPSGLVPAYHAEVLADEGHHAFVLSATTGEVLFRKDLVVADAFTYRVWADPVAPYLPWDGPQGTSPSPHPTGTPDAYDPPFVAPGLVTLQNGVISTNDPWLAPGAAQTAGNNVDAYADLVSPDGFSAGDLRASVTAPGAFDRAYDTSLAPGASNDQRMASVTQLFYTTNLLHDWFYDSGFDEAAGNAQQSNYGRGGIENDRLRAEAQDYGGTNNANMSTPADGAQPRMQMYVWNRSAVRVAVQAPPSIAGDLAAGTASFGPQSFDVSGDVVIADDGAAPAGDACTALVNAVAGKIVIVDRGACGFTTKVQNAQNAGALGVIVVDNVASSTPPAMSGTSGTITIPVLSVTQADGGTLKANVGAGLHVRLQRQPALTRDGTIDNLIVAHEWGHYISNRLVGNASGLDTKMAGGLGEGWADFHALLLAVRPEDALIPGHEDFDGVYTVGGYALTNSLVPNNAYYFGVRRYPYSTDLTKNPLTFRHIQDGVPLPVGPPVAFGADGANNSAVHRTGEVWCSMLWECYASLLRDTGRLTFDEARDRMRAYLVAAYKMTPGSPTLTEARDALIAAAAAADPQDAVLFWAAFARRGAGVGAVSPDRYSETHAGVIESFAVGGDLAVAAVALAPAAPECDGDAWVDEGETGELTVSVVNSGATLLGATTATVTSPNPAVTFPDGNVVALPPTLPFQQASAALRVRLSGAAGLQTLAFDVDANDPGLLVAGPRSASYATRANAEEAPSTIETVEAAAPPWTPGGTVPAPAQSWARVDAGGAEHRFVGPDPGAAADHWLMSPPLDVAPAGDFTFTFQHAYSFELSDQAYDGGVIEISADGGATWTDIGASATPGYTGTMFAGSGNPLGGRAAYVGTSAGYPALGPVSVNLGTAYAGQTVLVRFRIGADVAVGGPGWIIDDLSFTNLVNQPFLALVAEPEVCAPVAVGDDAPRELSLALAGGHPVTGAARFRFALPAAQRVRIAVYDVSGRRVAVLADGEYAAGTHDVSWSASVAGRGRTAGVYFVRMTAGATSLGRRVVVLP
uniref:PA domain-containing protein n=1 Tax=Eiseniibacteriota bacterium TaxID=2212470 RepID=A0A832I5P0_UNCEI